MPLRKFDDDVIYSPPFSDTIYHVTDKGLEPLYYLKIKGAKQITIDKNITDISLNEYKENNRKHPVNPVLI